MNRERSSLRNHSIVVAIAATILLAASSASAKEHKEKVSENSPHVVAHLAFNGTPAVGMALQRRADDTYYLSSSIRENVAYRSWMSGSLNNQRS
jgi:hypothetical protein